MGPKRTVCKSDIDAVCKSWAAKCVREEAVRKKPKTDIDNICRAIHHTRNARAATHDLERIGVLWAAETVLGESLGLIPNGKLWNPCIECGAPTMDTDDCGEPLCEQHLRELVEDYE